MHWLSVLIGALVGWLICWLIDYLICRPRRMAAEALLNAKLEECNEECASLRTQLTGYKDVQVRLDSANAEIGALQAKVAQMKDLQMRLDDANSQAAGLQTQLGDMKDVQVRLDDANAEIGTLKAQIAGMKDVQTDLVARKVQATQQSLEIERLNAELAARMSAGTAAAAAGVVAAADTAVRAGTLDTGVEGLTAAAPEAGIALATPAQPGQPDDLTRIEGIGPKINALFNQNDIFTFAQLAAESVERLQSILTAAGPRFRLANPETWPEQAAFARDGKWHALQALQDTLKGGRLAQWGRTR